MNILPKKRWHVRTKENIARVRKDEAEAAEKDRQERLRIENADREARLRVLKETSKKKLQESGLEIPTTTAQCQQTQEHINFFADFEHTAKSSNKEHDKEVKNKKEEYEKQIGYLTYLGQDTNEALGKKNWYEIHPSSSRFNRTDDIKETYNKLVLRDKDGVPRASQEDMKDGEVAWKAKHSLDPINKFRKYCFENKDKSTKKTDDKLSKNKTLEYEFITKKNKKHKKDKHTQKEDKVKKLQQLRESRLKREQAEKRRTEMFLSALNGTMSEVNEPTDTTQRVKPKYNSQFNPELARQNYM